MVFNFFKICCFIMVIKNFHGRTFGVKLGENCLSNQECETEYSRCHQESGTCSCLPYYARMNNTCLQSSLLGFECIVDEQCSLKVANSRCFNNVCECESKFWQYRRHTCLSPAKLGEVCYSDTHCKLSDEKNKCEFTIPGVFGFCICDSSSQTDCALRGQNSTLIRPNNSAFKYPFNKPDLKKKIPYQKRPWQTADQRYTTTTSTAKPPRSPVNKLQMPPLKRPILKTNFTNNGLKTTTIPVMSNQSSIFSTISFKNVTLKPQQSTAPTPSTFKIYLKNPLKDSQNKSQTATINNTSIKAHKKPAISIAGITLRKGESKKRVSLGLPCINDAQCMQNDENSRCINRICDCQSNNKTSDQCSAKNRGCLHNTFQCQSSGKCISWFFVCDGRTGDCGQDDNSDEECSGNQQCPSTTYACRSGNGLRNLCVSRSARCDGVKNCPLGDDEEGCNVTGNKGCPAYTFQCGDGQCLPEYELCNAVVTCADRSDELEGLCGGASASVVGNKTAARPPTPLTRVRGAYRHGSAECPFRCRNGRCRSTAVLCSGRDGCGDGSDESGCSVCKCSAVS